MPRQRFADRPTPAARPETHMIHDTQPQFRNPDEPSRRSNPTQFPSILLHGNCCWQKHAPLLVRHDGGASSLSASTTCKSRPAQDQGPPFQCSPAYPPVLMLCSLPKMRRPISHFHCPRTKLRSSMTVFPDRRPGIPPCLPKSCTTSSQKANKPAMVSPGSLAPRCCARLATRLAAVPEPPPRANRSRSRSGSGVASGGLGHRRSRLRRRSTLFWGKKILALMVGVDASCGPPE